MQDRVADGRFATKVVENGGRFRSGHGKLGGRRKGTPNKVTRAFKEWVALLISKVEVQDAIEERIKKGDAVAFFRAAEHAVGKPKETAELSHSGLITFKWEGDK